VVPRILRDILAATTLIGAMAFSGASGVTAAAPAQQVSPSTSRAPIAKWNAISAEAPSVPKMAVIEAAGPVTASRGTLIVSAPTWAVFANAALPNVTPVVITPTMSTVAAANAVADGAGVSCFFVACTLYIYRGSVRSIDSFVARYANASVAAIAGAFAVACAPLGGVGAVVCAAIGAVLGSYAIDQFNYAAPRNECIAVDFVMAPVPVIWNLHPDNGSACGN